MRSIAPLEPTPKNFAYAKRMTRRWIPIFDFVLGRNGVMTAEGIETLPDEPVMFMANHVSLIDPLGIIMRSNRMVHFLATEGAMQEWLSGTIVRTFASVPKKKFTVDGQAIRTLKRWSDLGGSIGIFPEGQCSWTGELLDFQPGVERLLPLFKLPLVTVRILNAERRAPRWAKNRRHGRVHLEFDPPVSFDRKTDPELLRTHLRSRLTVDPQRHCDWPIRGKRLAEGIANPLFACPKCFHMDALVDRGDHTTCRHCKARWRVDADSLLHPEGGGDPLPLRKALADICAAVKERGMAADPSRLSSAGLVMSSGSMTLIDRTDRDPKVLGQGRLQLHKDRLSMGDTWSIGLSDLLAVSVEMRHRLLFRTRDSSFEAVLREDSPRKWEWITEHWRKLAESGGG